MADTQYVVLAQWDAEAGVWFVKASDIPGLFIEAPTFDEFIEVVRDVAPDLLEDEGHGTSPISIDVKAEAVTHVVAKQGKAA